MKSIKCILQASIVYYSDNRQHAAYVTWLDNRGHQGRTVCQDYNTTRPSLHMQALLLRAMREGVAIQKECW
jgi:hypothetical protein